MGKNLYSNWNKVSGYHWNFSYGFLAASMLMFWLLQGLLALGWMFILKKLGVNIGFAKALKINSVSQLGKYLPGKVWLMAYKVYRCGKDGIAKRITFTSTIYENVLLITSGMLLVPFFLLQWQIIQFNRFILPSFGLMLAGLIVVHPAIFGRIANWILLKLKREPIGVIPHYASILLLLGFYLIYWLFVGIAFFLFFNSIHTFAFNDILNITGDVVFSSLAGFLAIFAPAGLGVREGVMALLLSHYVPMPVAIMLSLAHRIWVTISELSLIGGVTVTVR